MLHMIHSKEMYCLLVLNKIWSEFESFEVRVYSLAHSNLVYFSPYFEIPTLGTNDKI